MYIYIYTYMDVWTSLGAYRLTTWRHASARRARRARRRRSARRSKSPRTTPIKLNTTRTHAKQLTFSFEGLTRAQLETTKTREKQIRSRSKHNSPLLDAGQAGRTKKTRR